MPDAIYRVGPQHAGDRLDHCLSQFLNLSLRASKRLIDDGQVLLNNKRARPGQRVREEDVVCVAQITAPEKSLDENEKHASARLLLCNASFAFLYKPSLLHTVHLAGRNNTSLEDFLAHLLPGEEDKRLLQRLDYATSGIVTCALNASAEALFRAEESSGHVCKYYLCLLQGNLDHSLLMKARLVGKGARVQATNENNPDPARWTEIVPLKVLDAQEACFFLPRDVQDSSLTLAGCRIHRGFRHQIRAHCALAGHPLANDDLYGHSDGQDSNTFSPHKLKTNKERVQDTGTTRHFFLHHARLEFDQNVVESLPDWLSRIDRGEHEAHKWFAQNNFVGYGRCPV